MLWLRATDIFNSHDDKTDYSVNVGTGSTSLWNGYVRGHQTSEGVPALLRQIAQQMEETKVVQ